MASSRSKAIITSLFNKMNNKKEDNEIIYPNHFVDNESFEQFRHNGKTHYVAH